MSQCRVTFDCKASELRTPEEDVCDRDYNLSCPRGWILEQHEKGFFCRAGKEYRGPCAWRFPFEGYTKMMKRAFADRCNVSPELI